MGKAVWPVTSQRASYRVWQFLVSLFPRYAWEADSWVGSILLPREKELFDQLSDFEKAHAVRVARHLETRNISLLKAALLHDIGKIAAHFSVIDKVLYVVLSPILPRVIHWSMFARFRRYHDHEEIGKQLLLEAGTEADVIRYISISQQLKSADDRS